MPRFFIFVLADMNCNWDQIMSTLPSHYDDGDNVIHDQVTTNQSFAMVDFSDCYRSFTKI